MKQSNYSSATYLAIINATVWEFPKRENGGTHDSQSIFSLDYLDPGYSTNGNLTISSNNRV